MNSNSQQPHDKLVKTVLSDLEEAANFLRCHLPETLASQFDWQTLRLINASYVDEELRKTESDLLYQVHLHNSEQTVLIYVLFEHQSQPQKWMRLRLHKYAGRIWDESFKDHPEQSDLPPILPIVFYQGKGRWGYSTEFADLFPEAVRTLSFVPHFAHILIDRSGMDPQMVAGGLRAKVMQLLLYAAYHDLVEDALRAAAQLLAHLPESGGIDYMRVFVRYVFATQERPKVVNFARMADASAVKKGSEIMSYAEELLREGEITGEIKGEIKGQIETIEKLLRAGVTWETIEQATGIDPRRFAEMKKELVRLMAEGSLGTPSLN